MSYLNIVQLFMELFVCLLLLLLFLCYDLLKTVESIYFELFGGLGLLL